jgi:hypothetical protein
LKIGFEAKLEEARIREENLNRSNEAASRGYKQDAKRDDGDVPKPSQALVAHHYL